MTRTTAALLTVGFIAIGGACGGEQPAQSAAPTCPATEPLAASRCDAFDGECTYDDPGSPGNPCLRPFTATWSCADGLWSKLGQSTPGKCVVPGDSGTTDTCAPGDVSTFTPSWKPPTAFNQGKCSDAQTTAFVDCLSNMPDAATCKTFGADAANKPCIQCAATPSTAAAYGPLIEGTVTIEVNVAGCIANVTNDLSATGCGAKTIALSQCKQAACEPNCLLSGDGAIFDALLACEEKSAGSSCKAFADAAACSDALTGDGGVAAQCNLVGATFADDAKPMVKLFCGSTSGITDAGTGG